MNLSKCIIAHGDKNRLPPGRNELRPYVQSCISPLDLAPGARLYILHVAEHPLLYQQMLGLAERLAALVSLQEDAPEVDQLIEDVLASDELLTIFSMQSEFSEHISGRLASPIADVLSELTSDTLSPAQLRFLEAMSCILSDSSKEIGFPKESESEVGSPKVGIAEAGSEEVGSPEIGISEGGLEEVGSGEAGKSDQSQRKCSHGLYNQHRSSRAISPFSMRDTGKRVERDGVGSL